MDSRSSQSDEHSRQRQESRLLPFGEGPLVNTEIGSGLFIEFPLHDMRQHFEFPLAESVSARASLRRPTFLSAVSIPTNGLATWYW